MPSEIVIVGIGMATAVGLGRSQTASSVRASIARLEESALMSRANKVMEPFVLGCLPADALPQLAPELLVSGDLRPREARLARLGQAALVEALETYKESAPLRLLLGLSELESRLPLRADRVIDLLSVASGNRIDPSASRGFTKGRAAGLLAMKEGVDLLQAGSVRHVMVGGVDTHRDLYILGTLDMAGRVKSSLNLDAFIPGEGACFLLLTTMDVAKSSGATVLGVVIEVLGGKEPGHLGTDVPYKGEGLAALIQELIGQVGEIAPIADVYSSMNGEHYWAREWGVSYIRNKGAFDAEFRFHHPADCFGDVGAASGPLLVGLAAMDFGRERSAATSLVYSSSDFGDRAAMLMRPSFN